MSVRIAFSGTRRLVLLLAFWLAAGMPSGRAAGFDPEAGLPLIRNFLPETYRGHSQIFASVEDPAGVMYFGTYGQVVSFDGEHWRQHPTPGTWTRALTVGPDGLVYVGGGNALGRLETGAMGHLAFKSLAHLLPAEHREFASVWSAVTAGDTVLFAIDGATLAWAHGAFRVQPFPGRRPAVRAAGGATFCHVGDELRQWDGTGWKPFARDAVLGTARRLTVLAAPDGWRIALDTGALYQLGRDGRISPWPTAADEFLRRAGIRNGVVLPDGRWVLSTGGEGVLLLSPEGQPLQRLGPGSGLAHPATYGLTSSRQGLLWIETANGLSVLDPAARWSVFDPRNGRPDTIGGEPQRFEDEIVVTMSDLAPVRLRPAATPFDQARLEPYLDSGPTRLSNTVVVHGALLSGHERGLLRLSRPPRPVHASSSQIEDVLSLAQLPGLVVVGMLRGIELVRVSPEFDATLVGRVPDFELEITNAREFPDRTVWVGTTSGVALRLRLNPDGTLRDATRFGSDRGLPAGSGWVKIQRAPDGPIVCVRDGVFRLDPTGERLGPDPRFAIHRPSGINTLPIEGDGGGRFWFQIPGGEAGFQLGCLDTRAGASRWTLLPPALNAALGYGGARSITYLPEGERQILWVSGTRATLRLDLSAPESLPPPPAVVISQAAQGSTRWKPTADVQGLPFRRETLQFRFSSPSATLAPVRYETRLVGYAGDWTPVSAPEATFTNLVGGPFTLEVRATDAWGRTGPASRASFRVAPPWHRTPLALGVYALALGGGVAGFVRWRLGRSERERARLEQLVAQRTRELATARDAAESANRAKSSFLAAMSHELRTPLNGVIGYAQILQADARLAPDQKERLGIVLHSGEHLLRMINDVLDLAKIEAGKVELRPAPFALPDFLRDVAAGHAPAAARKGLAFELQADGALPPRVLGDGQKLRQVLDNLIGNAIKFTAHGRVTVQVHSGRPVPGSAAPLVFAVTDTGPGIEPSDQARLFQPFEQAGTHGDTPGTGLGLSICRSLVERMGGTLTLQSTPGQGSVFAVTVDLPSVTVTEDEPAPTLPPPELDGSGRRVWVIDDHAVNRRLVIDVLSPLGFACTESSSASEALERLLTETGPWPDLVVVDVRMTGVDGLEFTRRFRAHARGQHARILLMSASVLSFDPAAGRSAGADDFLAKPFRTADLLGTVGRLLGLASRPMPPAPPPPAASAPPPAAAAARLRETLDSGDLDEFRRLVAGYRRDHPESDTLWRRLDEAAGAFQLSRLRQLLESA